MFFYKKLLIIVILVSAPPLAYAEKQVPDVAGSVGDVEFPKRDKAYLSKGDFVNVDNLRKMRPGLSKDQVRLLLGNPHFTGGLFSKDWNYVFNFRTGNGDEYITCQYQARFGKHDEGRRIESLHWDVPACLELLNRAEPAPSPAPVERISLKADALFRFARSGTDDILPWGQEELDAVARKLRQDENLKVKVIGYTDRLGSEASNQALSERRAETVRDYLHSNGVKNDIDVEGRGGAEPVKECSDNQPRAELIRCLTPNRRVELIIDGA